MWRWTSLVVCILFECHDEDTYLYAMYAFAYVLPDPFNSTGDGDVSMVSSRDLSVKKKRGRPRKRPRDQSEGG